MMSQQHFEPARPGWKLRLRPALWGVILGGMRRKFSRCSATVCLLVALIAAPAAVGAGAPSRPGKIAFMGTDDQIYWCTGDCAKPECITCPKQGFSVRRAPRVVPGVSKPNITAVTMVQEPGMPPPQQERPPSAGLKYGWPTFSPDGSKIAFGWAGPAPDGNFFGLTVYDFTLHVSIPIFASNTEKIAYIQWTPDGTHISFLVNEPQGLSLILAQVKEKAPVRMLLSGAPIYYAWNDKGDKLIAHFNTGDDTRSEKIAMLEVTPTDQEITRTLARGRSPFKAPSWSADGKHLAYVGNVRAETYIDVADADGKNPRALASLPVGESSIVWSPDSRHIAYSTAVIGEELLMHGIRTVDIQSGESKKVTSDDVLAFFYSPDGNYLAYIGVPAKMPYYVWSVIDLKTGKIRTLDKFLSTQEEALVYRYFDQLALSHAIWSPDSKEFVYAGVRAMGDAEHPARSAPEPSLWIVPIDGSKERSYQGAVAAIYSSAAH